MTTLPIVPEGWRALTAAEIAGGDRAAITIGPFGSNLRTTDYRTSGTPLIFVRDIRSRQFASPSKFVSDEKARELRSHRVEPGDVLITKMGDPPGDAAVYTGAGDAILTADCIRLRPMKGLDPTFVAYAFGTRALTAQMAQITRGVAQRKVSLSRFRDGIRIAVPTYEVQRRIVEILEDHLSRLDAADQYRRAALRRLDAMVASQLARAGAGALRSLADISTIQGGIQKQQKRTPRDHAFPFLRVANVTARGLDLRDVHQVELFGDELNRLRLQAGDLLVVEGNGSASQIGRAATWDGTIENCVHQNHLIRVRPHAELLPAYLEAVWNSPRNREALTALASSSSGLYTLSVRKLKTLQLRVPSLEDQLRLVQDLCGVREARDRLEASLLALDVRSERLRRAVLAAAFSGALTGRATEWDAVEELADAQMRTGARADEPFNLAEVTAPNTYHLQEVIKVNGREDLSLDGDRTRSEP